MSLWSKLPKFDLSKTEDKLKFFILVSGLLIFLGVGTATAIQLTMSPDFCKACHVMQPQYSTWAASSHSEIACTECHIPPGVANLMIHKVYAMKELYHYVFELYPNPIITTKPISSDVCSKCHSIDNRNWTYSGDLIMPHARHMDSDKAEIECISCHYGVAHGKISRRGVAKEGDPESLHGGDLKAWTAQDGVNQTIHEYVKADMDDCIACHVEKGQTMKCEACHQTIKTPDNHYPEKQWLPVHGKDAQKNVGVCVSCHSYGMKVEKVDVKDKTLAYAWGNQFCIDCHKQAPEDHRKADWRKVHKNNVANKGEFNCRACHKLDKDGVDSNSSANAPASVTCSKCH